MIDTALLAIARPSGAAVATVAVLACLGVPAVRAQTAENVAVVINDASPESKEIGDYYVKVRAIPAGNVIHIQAPVEESVPPGAYLTTIQQPIAAALGRGNLHDRILYIVLTKGVPLRILGTGGPEGTVASVDSELALLYRRMAGQTVLTRGRVDNPYFLGSRPVSEARGFTHRDHDVFLVSRLDAFTVPEAKALVDRGFGAARDGRIVLDQRGALVSRLGEDWLALAAQNLAKAGHGDRVILENTPKPARDVTPVIGYYSWGSIDPQNRVRTVKMDFTPGAIAASFVGTDARTFREPPAAWLPTNTTDRGRYFEGSSQSLVGDLVREGATGVAGQVSEPYLQSAVRPELLFEAYLAGFNLIEAFYLAIPHLSWQTVVVGDPLARPFPRTPLQPRDIDGGLDAELDLPSFFAKHRLTRAASRMPGASEQAVRLVVRGETALARGDRPGARRLLEEASALAPEVAALHVLLAEFHTTAGEPELAAQRYEKVLALQPNSTVALNNLAYDLAVRQNKPAEALPMARKALALAPRDATVLDTVGWIEYLLGNTAEASRLLVQAARGAAANPEIRLHNAIALAALGARATAETELAETLLLDPEFEKRTDVAELRSKLKQ